MRMRSPVLLVGFPVFFCLGALSAHSQTKPVVVSTNPPNGATGVSTFLSSFSITFSKPMDTTRCGASTRSWPYPPSGLGGSCTWSTDKLTMTVTRYNPDTPLAAGLKIEVYVNDPQDQPFLRDAESNYIDTYYFSFTIASGEGETYELLKTPADPSKGFQWPYYLSIPTPLTSPSVLLVTPNNTGYCNDDPAVHDQAAKSYITSLSTTNDVVRLGSPILVPTFPRPMAYCTTYIQALDEDTLKTTLPGLQRVDLQLVAMIEDAKQRLAARGFKVDAKVFIWGFSASGAFSSRFTALHPDLIKAASIGSPLAEPVAPVSEWNGKRLWYPVGVADLPQLVGKPFDLESFRKVPLQIYMGDADPDPWLSVSSEDVKNRDLIWEVFGGPPAFERWPAIEAVYRSRGCNAQFVIYPGVAHTYGPGWTEIWKFFEQNRATPIPAPLPKPFLYTVYFPHVSSFGSWETEIALTNTAEVPIQGQLRGYSTGGGSPIESLPVTIPALGRVEITVGQSFQHPQEIAYISLLSDSGFLAGYTRFYQPGNRCSLALGTGSNRGWLPKVEKDGWTGVAFLNVDTVAASVTLTAWDDNGKQVATTTLSLRPGEKTVGMVTQLFQSDLKDATYCTYKSDKKLLGFTVSGSSNGQMLDGLHALGDYISARK
jgi:hypothetical protein